MTKDDHLQTASHSSQPGSEAYRARQEELLSQGRFDEAFQNDIDDIRAKFGDKYDDAIEQAIEYRNSLNI